MCVYPFQHLDGRAGQGCEQSRVFSAGDFCRAALHLERLLARQRSGARGLTPAESTGPSAALPGEPFARRSTRSLRSHYVRGLTRN